VVLLARILETLWKSGANTDLHVLIPLPIASNDVVALALQTLAQMRCDEATSSSNTNLQLTSGPVMYFQDAYKAVTDLSLARRIGSCDVV
jgi:hypothetical protein